MNKQEYENYIKNYKEINRECIQQNKHKKMFIEILPTKKVGNKKLIDWKNSVGYDVYFICNNLNGYVHIVNYNNCRIDVIYKDRMLNMSCGHFKNCKIQNLLGIKTSDFKYKIGQNIEDNNRNITITDLKRINNKRKNGKNSYDKYYKYKCNKCGYECGEYYKNGVYNKEYWINESGLNSGNNCIFCSGQIVISGVNDIATTDKWMVKYLKNKNDAYKYSHYSDSSVEVICDKCGRIKNKKMELSNIYKYNGINCICDSSISKCEKIMFIILEKLTNNKFIHQLTIRDCKWCGKYRYDFYFKLNGEEYIIETHGIQHYKENATFHTLNSKTFIEQKQNDLDKYNLAIQNGIKHENYIVIDCSKSKFDFIVKNIINSKLNKIFNFENINFEEVEKEFNLLNK